MATALGSAILSAMTTAMWFTGRRRTVRALVYGASAILTMACAAGLVLGHVELAWRVAGAEPTQRLLTHGGAVGLVGLAVVAGLTVYGWHAELSGALAASGTSILALTTVAHVWLGVHASALDAAATQSVVATLALAVVLVARVVSDVLLDGAEHRARAAGAALPIAVRV